MTEPLDPEWRHSFASSGTMEPDGQGGMRPARWCRYCGPELGWPWPCDAERMRLRAVELDRQLVNAGIGLVRAQRRVEEMERALRQAADALDIILLALTAASVR